MKILAFLKSKLSQLAQSLSFSQLLPSELPCDLLPAFPGYPGIFLAFNPAFNPGIYLGKAQISKLSFARVEISIQ